MLTSEPQWPGDSTACRMAAAFACSMAAYMQHLHAGWQQQPATSNSQQQQQWQQQQQQHAAPAALRRAEPFSDSLKPGMSNRARPPHWPVTRLRCPRTSASSRAGTPSRCAARRADQGRARHLSLHTHSLMPPVRIRPDMFSPVTLQSRRILRRCSWTKLRTISQHAATASSFSWRRSGACAFSSGSRFAGASLHATPHNCQDAAPAAQDSRPEQLQVPQHPNRSCSIPPRNFNLTPPPPAPRAVTCRTPSRTVSQSSTCPRCPSCRR